MNIFQKSWVTSLLIPLLLLAVCIGSIFDYAVRNRQLAQENIYQTLDESAAQQLTLFQTKIESQFSQLRILADYVSRQGAKLSQDTFFAMNRAAREYGFYGVGLIDAEEKIARLNVGVSFDATGREYFERALAGESYIEYVRDGRGENSRVFVLAVPIYQEDRVAAVLIGSYVPEDFARLLRAEALSGQSYTFLTDSRGVIIVESNHASALITGDDTISFFASARLEKGVTVEDIREDLREGRSRSFFLDYQGAGRYVAYRPVNISDWVIFSVATEEVAASHIAASSRLVFLLSLKLFLAFIGFIIFVLVRERRNRLALARSEEEYRVAAGHSGKAIVRYDIREKTLCYATGYTPVGGVDAFPTTGAPESVVAAGLVAEESVADFLEFFAAMGRGEPSGSQTFRLGGEPGQYAWYHVDYTLLSGDDPPRYAVISYYDVTRQREIEIAYEKWRQSVSALPYGEFKLFEHNLTQDVFEREEGGFMQWLAQTPPVAFNERARATAESFVYAEDRETYLEFLNRERLLAQFYQGHTEETAQFRVLGRAGDYRWVELSVQTVPYPDSIDVKVYLLFRDIHEEKTQQLAMKELSEIDSLTKALNRATFISRAEKLLAESDSQSQHAFLFLDMDLFKQINDVLGHAAGDQCLAELANSLKSLLRKGDLLGRVGGDEFIICLENISYTAAIEKRARQICDLIRRRISDDITVSVSLGISLYPQDGHTFAELYEKADAALYQVKKQGGDNFAFYNSSLVRETAAPDSPSLGQPVREQPTRTMLIVDDVALNRTILAASFQDRFNILTAGNGGEALDLMSRYGSGISIVLLDIFMPEVDGLEVLRRMSQEPVLASIPVVVVSGAEEEEMALAAIELGASDFVPKPIDARLISIRVYNAIAKAESERLRAQNSYLRLQSMEEARYRHVLSSTGTGIVEYDRVNQVFAYDSLIPKVLAGTYDNRSLWDIFRQDRVAEPADIETMRQLVETVADSPTQDNADLTLTLASPRGDKRWFLLAVRKLGRDQSDQGKLLITFNDVHEDYLKNERLRHLAEHDALTGLLNRAAFMERTAALLQTQAAGSYVMIHADIDRFKVINELFGHGEGDRLLRFVAATIERFAGSSGLSCRLSADYFAACLQQRQGLVDGLLSYVEQALASYGLPFEITLTYGFYEIDDPELGVDLMLDRAAMAQKTVKGNYLRRFAIYDDALRVTMLEEQEIVGRADAALAAGEFDIYLQPQYDHEAKKIIGAEALVRWFHPQKGIIQPTRFIPIFEKNGFISKLDSYVWERTCRLLQNWAEQGREPLKVSVNISRLDIYNPRLCQNLCRLVEEHHLPPGLLKLEITESAYVENPQQLIEVVKDLQAQGFIIEMDDFGSGYSSLNTLKDVPVDVLKMDMKFLSAESADQRTDNILKSIIDMAHGIGLGVIAEGVESKAQADHLLTLGCRVVQGFYYARPMPVADFEVMLDNMK